MRESLKIVVKQFFSRGLKAQTLESRQAKFELLSQCHP